MKANSAPATADLSRRTFVVILAGGIAAVMPADAQTGGPPRGAVACRLTINGQPRDLLLDPRVTLLDLLREHLALTGTKKGCDHGQCGACTVLVNGRRVNSCLSLAVTHQGDSVTTIEGLSRGDDLHPMQAAFVDNDGFQCGFCTPGQICSAVALVDEVKRNAPSAVTADIRHVHPVDLTDEEIRERMSGNLCRCGAYPGILSAVRSVARRGAA